MKPIEITEIAAWWGAVIATLVFLWDIFKWKTSGPRLKVKVNPNMKYFNGLTQQTHENAYIVFEIFNRGDRPTTLTDFGLVHYMGYLQVLLRHTSKTLWCSKPFGSQPIPYVLAPGERWIGAMLQPSEKEGLFRTGLLYGYVQHSGSSKIVMTKIKKKRK